MIERPRTRFARHGVLRSRCQRQAHSCKEWGRKSGAANDSTVATGYARAAFWGKV
jgi:hypothetical protein